MITYYSFESLINAIHLLSPEVSLNIVDKYQLDIVFGKRIFYNFLYGDEIRKFELRGLNDKELVNILRDILEFLEGGGTPVF